MPANARSYHFVLIAPEGDTSIACLGELLETMAFGLQALGCSTSAELNAFRPGAINIVLGAHLLPRGFDAIPEHSIIYNSEQIFPDCPALAGALAELVARNETWDYSLRNIEAWKTLDCRHVRHLPTGYVPKLSRIASAPEQDIDVLFYGAVNPRRRQLLDALKAHGIALQVVGGVYGAQRDALIARSKVVLNLHYHPSHIFETARVSYLLANRKAVVAEVNPDTEIDERYAAAVEARPYAGLVQACLDLLHDPAARKAREERGYALMQSMPAQDFLAPLIARRVFPDTALSVGA